MLDIFKKALTIRLVEKKIMELYSQGYIHGTVHTCVGQEFSGLAFLHSIQSEDYVVSNHRGHGHYLSYNMDIYGLLAEILGKKGGVCSGIGGSQHLCKDHFMTNGIQGGMMPIAAGIAMAQKYRSDSSIVIIFIGDGTLGEGIVYETMNIVSKYEIPLLIVCENNQYAQSTSINDNLAGDIIGRAKSFGIRSCHSNIWDLNSLMTHAKESVNYVRQSRRPCFHLVDMYRLNPHSKGDDYRQSSEINRYSLNDPLNVFEKNNPTIFNEMKASINEELEVIVHKILTEEETLTLNEYITNALSINDEADKISKWYPVKEEEERQSHLLNQTFHKMMKEDKNIIFIGEDVADPYGGAFKISNALSIVYPDRVLSTPISESAITGLAIGLSMVGFKPILEIMFGDFITLCLDQIINHASKFKHIFNKQFACPIIVRTPMGGGRGYGPTHSQTLDKFLMAIDNINIIALNTFVNPQCIYEYVIANSTIPTIFIENKIDYSHFVGWEAIPGFACKQSDNPFPVIKIGPNKSVPDITIVTYGMCGRLVTECLYDLFFQHDIKAEVIILTKIKPIDYTQIIDSVMKTQIMFVVEEGSSSNGFGSEVVASIAEILKDKVTCHRISSLAYPIPAVHELENDILISKERIINMIAACI